MASIARLLAVCLAALVLCAAAAADLGQRPTTAADRRTARRDAARNLSLVVLPRGSRTVTKPPSKELRYASSAPGTPALVDRHRIWKVRESVGAVSAFEDAHTPRGSRKSGAGVSNRGPQQLTFSFPAYPGWVSSREVLLDIVPLGHGWTGIRADAQDIWVLTRKADEVVPAAVRTIELRTSSSSLVRRITSPAKVAKIVRWFDALPVKQPGVYHCPALFAGPTATLDFLDGVGRMLAQASVLYNRGLSGPCNPISFRSGGHKRAPLVGGRFFARVERLAG